MKRTPRGFAIFAKGYEIRVQESSAAFEGAHAWIFQDDRPCHMHLGKMQTAAVHLSVAQAKVAIAGLTEFVRAAEAGELMEPADAPREEPASKGEEGSDG